MSLFLDIGQGAGLAGSSGVRPYLPPLLAGALARGNIGLDFSGTSYSFLESPWWLVLMFALAVLSYLLERRRPELARSRAATWESTSAARATRSSSGPGGWR
jgi:hypothetical protein